jgi:hypothetical protein
MCQCLVVQYMMKRHKYVAVSSYRVHNEASEIFASTYLYITWRNIRNMCQYLVVQYTMKHQMNVPVSSCTVHDEASEICVNI